MKTCPNCGTEMNQGKVLLSDDGVSFVWFLEDKKKKEKVLESNDPTEAWRCSTCEGTFIGKMRPTQSTIEKEFYQRKDLAKYIIN